MSRGVDLTPSMKGYMRMLEIISKNSTSKADRAEARRELKALKSGATYNGGGL